LRLWHVKHENCLQYFKNHLEIVGQVLSQKHQTIKNGKWLIAAIFVHFKATPPPLSLSLSKTNILYTYICLNMHVYVRVLIRFQHTLGLTDMTASIFDSVMTCSFSRNINVTGYSEDVYSLSQQYFLQVGDGPIEDGECIELIYKCTLSRSFSHILESSVFLS
jgi:hypothetical protein